jgi:hypothetical protein
MPSSDEETDDQGLASGQLNENQKYKKTKQIPDQFSSQQTTSTKTTAKNRQTIASDLTAIVKSVLKNLKEAGNIKRDIRTAIESEMDKLSHLSKQIKKLPDVNAAGLNANEKTCVIEGIKSLTEGQKTLMETIKDLTHVHQKQTNSKPKSWAEVTSPNTHVNVNNDYSKTIGKTKPTFSSTVRAKDSTVSHEKVCEIFKKEINPRQLKCGITKLSRLSNNTIRLEFETESERDTVIDAVNKTKSLKSEISKKKKLLVIVKGVQNDVLEGELIEAIAEQNTPVKNVINDEDIDNHIKLRFKRKNRNEHLCNYVFEVSPKLRNTLLDLQRVNVNYQRVHVNDFSSFLQCYKCMGFGHTTKHCKVTSDVCGICAGKHKTGNCPDSKNKNAIKCYNCIRSNVKFNKQMSTSHSATSNSCPHVIKMQQRAIELTDYVF